MNETDAPVVVVDDDPSVRRGLARLLRSWGYRVETLASAREFLGRGDDDRPGCLVIDVRMPGQSGVDLQQVLEAGGNDTPVIFITGYGDVPTAVRSTRAGAVELLAKPFDDEALLSAVRRAMAQRQRRSGDAERFAS